MLLDRKLHNCYLCSIRPLMDKTTCREGSNNSSLIVTVFHSLYSVHGRLLFMCASYKLMLLHGFFYN